MKLNTNKFMGKTQLWLCFIFLFFLIPLYLLQNNIFWFTVITSSEHMQRISDVKNTIAQLYSLLNVEEHQLNRERDLVATLEKLKADLEPLEKVCSFIC